MLEKACRRCTPRSEAPLGGHATIPRHFTQEDTLVSVKQEGARSSVSGMEHLNAKPSGDFTRILSKVDEKQD